MSVNCRIEDKLAVISVHGRFNFALHQEFRTASLQAIDAPGITDIEINLFHSDYVDSSALGMLLVLREQASGKGMSRMKVVGAKGSVKKVLEIAKFDKFFTIE